MDMLSKGVLGCDPAGFNGVDSPIAGLVRAVTPLVLEDNMRAEAGGARVLMPLILHNISLSSTVTRLCLHD